MEKNNVSLYCVPTPIGNLSDITERALEVLGSVDFIAAEDTRKSGVLLKHFGIKKPMISYFEHNRRERGEMIVERLKNGEVCALITDAGTPAVSDPGEELVAQCFDAGLVVSSLPGPCAATTALSMSGLPTRRFCFEGFLSTAKNSRDKHLSSLEKEERTMIFYEAPHHLCGTLEDMRSHFGNRRITLIREISKIYEEARRTTLDEAVEYYSDKPVKGEFVLIVEGYIPTVEKADTLSYAEEFDELVASGKSKSDASKIIAEKYGLRRREVYEAFKNR